MEVSVIQIRHSMRRLQELISTQTPNEDKKYISDLVELNAYTERDLEGLLTFLRSRFLDEYFTRPIAIAFEQLLLLIITTAISCDEDVNKINFLDYQKKCIALAKVMHFSADVKRYVISYFRNKPPPFNNSDNILAKPKNKKSESDSNSMDLAIIKCCYQLLYTEPVFFRELWNWSEFIKENLTIRENNDLKQVYCNHIIAILTDMTATQLYKMNENFPSEVLHQIDAESENTPLMVKNEKVPLTETDNLYITLPCLSDLVTQIEGVFLSIFNKNNFKFFTYSDGSYDKIVRVDSTRVNLRSIALGISSGKAICLSGPVGCGKTTLVEYLARKTGRISPKPKEIRKQQKFEKNNSLILKKTKTKMANFCIKRKVDFETDLERISYNDENTENGFLRIQLGDQTDSKLLLGQYRCTDVPGEFVWLPGVLTKAVMNGYWLLLEDLDAATQDTYTILGSLLENNYLSVPGFRDCLKIEPGFQLFTTVRINRSGTPQKSFHSLLEKHLYTINILPLSRNELCKVISTNYPRLSTVANRIVDVFLTFSSGDHSVADNLRQQETIDKVDYTGNCIDLPFEQVKLSSMPNSGRMVSTRDLIKLCQRSNPMFSVTSTECAYFVFENAVDVFCSYLPQGKDKIRLITSIGAKLGIIHSRCEYLAEKHRPDLEVNSERIKVGRAELFVKKQTENDANLSYGDEQGEYDDENTEPQRAKRQRLSNDDECSLSTTSKSPTFSFTRMASCILERIAVCVAHAEPVLLVGETGVGKTSSVQYLAERTRHKLIVVNMNNQSDVSDLIGGFKPVDLTYVLTPLRCDFETLFRKTFNESKNQTFLTKFSICYTEGSFAIIIKLMLKVLNSVFEKSERKEYSPQQERELLPRWRTLKTRILKLSSQLTKSLNVSFAFIPGSLVNCIKNGDWVLLDEINLASAETLECLSTILEPNGSVVLLEKGDYTPVRRHRDFRIFACMNPNTDIGKKDLPVGIRNRFTEFFVDELTTESDLNLLISDYLSTTGIQTRSVGNIVKLYKRLKQLAQLELNDGLGNRPVYSLRTLCRALRTCAKNLCGSIERNLFESFCMSFLTQLDPTSHNIVLKLIRDALLSNSKAVLKQVIPKPGEDYLNFGGYWIQVGSMTLQECANYILTDSVGKNLKDLARIISIGKLPVLLQGPTSAGKTSLIEYVAKRSGNNCLRINNHEHTDLQEYIGTYTADVTGKLSFKEGVLVQAMRNGYWIILDELNLASTDILEALNRVLDDNRELFIAETQTTVKAHKNFMLFATQNPPGLYGGRKTLSRAFKNRFIELHFSEIPRDELEIILERRCLIPTSYAKKMVMCMSDLHKNRKTTSKNMFTLRDLFRWGNRYTFADKALLLDKKYDWNQHLVEEGYLVLSARVRTHIEIEIIEETLYRNFKKRLNLAHLFEAQSEEIAISPVTRDIIAAIKAFKQRRDIVWTRNMTRMAVLTAKALQFNEPVLLVGPTGCGKTTICQILAAIHNVKLRILNCHMHTEGADFLGGLRPCRQTDGINGSTSDNAIASSQKLFEWADGPLIHAMQEGSYFMADEISLAEDSVLERLNCILEPERTVLLAEKGGVTDGSGANCTNSKELITNNFVIKAQNGFQFMATMNPGGDFGKKELSPALRNRFTEIWCLPSDTKEDLIQITSNCMLERSVILNESIKYDTLRIATYLVEIVLYMHDTVEKFKYSIRDVLAWANYVTNTNENLSFPEKAIFGLETIFLDALEMLQYDSIEKVERLKHTIIEFAIKQADLILNMKFTLHEVESSRGVEVIQRAEEFGIKPFFIHAPADAKVSSDKTFLFDAPTTKKNLFRLLSALTLKKPVLLEGPPGVGKTSIVENLAHAVGYQIVRINLCEHTDLADLFGTDLPAEAKTLDAEDVESSTIKPHMNAGSFVWRDGPLLAALKSENTWILLDELNLAPQSVLEGLNAILDHRGEVYIPELNKSFALGKQTRIFACQNPLKQGGGRKGLPQSFLNRFIKVYLRKLSTDDLLFVVSEKYSVYFEQLRMYFLQLLKGYVIPEPNLFELYKTNTPNIRDQAQAQLPIDTFDLPKRLVHFSQLLDQGIEAMAFGYKGGPYEINLRDILRWCDLLVHSETGFIFNATHSAEANSNPVELFKSAFDSFLLTLYERMKLVYYQRMRSEHDKLFIRNAFAKVFNCDAERLNNLSEDISLYWSHGSIYLNDIVLKRGPRTEQALRQLKSPELSPLLLTSQREILKNIVECVHMEKPVLLCGATDTGKTKLIDTLCSLSNQICNTDTIDDSVTGSFQQIDLNRHLEDLSQRIECIFMSSVRNMILARYSANVIAELLNTWSKYSGLANVKHGEFNNTGAMSRELKIFRKRIQHLREVIQQLLLLDNEYSIAALEATCRTVLLQQDHLLELLLKRINVAQSLNTGGSFEWVDSKIVKSLKCGQYILLEHVNMCSSAVLDRLNPLFEPNGKLLISEKGVSNVDEAEIVARAPNFRAFLTIDPKNGELSRAMRNRCIELALSKELYDVDDMRSIIHLNGVCSIDAINCILAIHERVLHLTEMQPYSISHMAQFAFLTAAYNRIGYNIERALYVSGMEVYVYSANTDLLGYGLAYYQNQLRGIVLDETKKFDAATHSSHVETDHLANLILNVSELDEMALIKLQTEPLKLLLKSNQIDQQVLTAHLKSLEQINFDGIQHFELMRFFIYILYETSSMNDVKLRNLYLRNILKSQRQLLQLSDNLYARIQSFIQHFNNNLTHLPWNRKLYKRIRDYATERGACDTVQNKMLNLSSLLVGDLLVLPIPSDNVTTKLQQIDAFTYSQLVANKSITDKLNNKFLLHLSGFLTRLHIVLKSTLAEATVNVTEFVQIATACLWFNRMLDTSQLKLFINKQLDNDMLDRLLLHFTWLEKNLLRLLMKISPEHQQRDTDFDTSLKNIKHYISSVKQPLNITRKTYVKQLTDFQPFHQESQVKYHMLAEQMADLLNVIPVYGCYTPEFILKKFLAQKSDAAKVARNYLTKMITNGFEYKFIEVHLKCTFGERLPQELRRVLQDNLPLMLEQWNNESLSIDPIELVNALATQVELIQEILNSQDEPAASVKLTDIELGMLPLREYFLNKVLLQKSQSVLTLNHKINVIYCEAIPSLHNRTWQLIELFSSTKYQYFLTVWLNLMNYIKSINTGEDYESLLAYLNGIYKQLNSCHHLISNLLINQQLNNLTTRLKCSQILQNIDEIDCHYAYEGPSLLSMLFSLVLENDGHLKPVPLNNLELWKLELKRIRQLFWHNSMLMTSDYDTLLNNLSTSHRNAKKLLLEVAYVKRLCSNIEQDNHSDYNRGFQTLLQLLNETYAQVDQHLQAGATEPNIFRRYQHSQYQCAILNTLVGSIELCLLTFTPPIDPVEKKRLKNLYIREDIKCLKMFTTVYDFMKVIMKYKHFGDEIYVAFEDRLKVVGNKQQEFAQKLACRPDGKCLYSKLVQDLRHFLESNCEPHLLKQLIENVQQLWNSQRKTADSSDECATLLNRIDLWIANSQRFVHHILKPYQKYYEDITQPIRCAIDKLRFGFEGLKVALTQFADCMVGGINDSVKIHQLLTNIIEFPRVHPLHIFNMDSTLSNTVYNTAPIFDVLKKLPDSEHDYFRLLKVKLSELLNIISISGNISEETFREFDFTLSICNQLWHTEEESRRKKQAEDESLYVNKTKCKPEDEELEEIIEIAEHFPTNVQEDFGEFMEVEESLEQVMKLNDRKEHLKTTLTSIIRDEDYGYLVRHFTEIMQRYTKHVYYHNPPPGSGELTFVESFKECMLVFHKIFMQYRTHVSECLDETTYNSLVFVVGLQQETLDEVVLPANGRSYNFYKDSNIPEIINCTTVLERIEKRVIDQLTLYTEHAGLLDIMRVIGRVRSLPSNAPVARFNSGFQILRQKISQWNEVAHKNNNLRDEEVEVAGYIQRWTKLELQHWRNCLTQTYEKIESTTYKYWFFIYNLFQEYMEDHALDTSYTEIQQIEKRFVVDEIWNSAEMEQSKVKVSASDIVRILRQFMEAANYGDFHVRLNLLQAFELYLHNVGKNSNKRLNASERNWELISGLRNLQIYFAQFVQEIEDIKRDIRAPIEKKLKEFVKIESYNKDLSYFSMRNNIQRVHRNLNKFLKDYEQQLQQKITPIFKPKDATVKDYNLEGDKGKDLRYGTSMKSYMVDVKLFLAAEKMRDQYAEQTTVSVDALTADQHTLLQKVGKLFYTSRNVVKETVTNAKFSKLIISLDALLHQQLERCEHLRNLTVDRSKERPKQVLEAKQILQQKRKALSDLFKILIQLGLSYKTGMMELSLRSEFEDFTVPPFCIKTMLGAFQDKRIQAKILHLNENLDRYFAKCVFKLRLLQNVMLTPLSELGTPNIERIKGFSVDLFLLVQNQRQLLAKSSKNIYDLRAIIRDVKQISEISSLQESFEQSYLQFSHNRNVYMALKTAICHMRYVLEQFKILINCMPTEQDDENQVVTLEVSSLTRNSAYCNKISKICDDALQLAKDTIGNMAKHDTEFICFKKLTSYQATYSELLVLIGNVKKHFETNIQSVGVPITKPLTDLLNFAEEMTRDKFKHQTEKMSELDLKSVELELENILHSILLSLQKLYKKYPRISAPSANGDCNCGGDDVTELQEHHLKKKLHEELVADWNIMNLPHVITKLDNILLTLKHCDATIHKLAYIRKLTTILPILEQYQLMADYYLYQQLGAHKVSAKMLSIMLTLFVEVSTKGFCVPADLMQDEEGDVKKEQKEGEGFGLEDGTGEKDASDKIESEDQLDDAKRSEDRNDEKEQQDDCKEEKGIEMSDDFDGKMQDIEKPENEEDDSGESEDEEDLNKEMGETEEGADKLDDQIWGDDEDEPEEQEKDLDEEENAKGSKDEKDTHNDLDKQNEKSKNDETDEYDKDGLDATDENNTNKDQKKKDAANDIENIKDDEIDEDQINPYHNELEEPPEAEEMDLGDMNNADEEHDDDDEQQGDENPFDIDKMKDNMPKHSEEEEEQVDELDGVEGNNENVDEADSSEDEATADTAGKDEEKQANEEQDMKQEDEEPGTQKRRELNTDTSDENHPQQAKQEDEKPERHEHSQDKSSKEENVQSVPETENKGSADEVKDPYKEKDIKQDQKLDEQDTGEEKDGVGQAENETNDGGHQGIAETKDTLSNEERKNECHTEEKRKQGRTNEERTLGEAEKNKLKQLKTIDKLKEQEQNENAQQDETTNENETEAHEYQHVKEPNNSDKATLDNATEEQSRKIQQQSDNEEVEVDAEAETNDELMNVNDDQDNEDNKLEEQIAEKFDQRSDKPSKSEKINERAETQNEEMKIEGEVVSTMTVPRSNDTTAHCIKEILFDHTTQSTEEPCAAQTLELRKMYQQQLAANSKTLLPQHEDYETWQTISIRMSQNARELCEQLRLILEPTKCTRLKGDYRTGRRINMKKIIPYIASQFRKDKIWLRRTKPAQRDYKITIAIDDSKSMHHNNSKTLTLEAISLVSQALTLLESGRLSIMSFGETPHLILNHTEQFDGPKLVSTLNFVQDKTKIAELLDFVRTANVEEGIGASSENGLFENLLLILSDGRNIYSEGKVKVKNAIKLARLQRIFLVYIIIDNPENKNSILDIQTMEMLPDKRINIKSYLDEFPFPYYVIVRDLNQLPLVLSEAMRQWFELVNSDQ